MHILMVAAENDMLPNCKVGGVADVIRDIPYALGNLNHKVSVVVPDYGESEIERVFVCDLKVPFRHSIESATLFKVMDGDNVAQYIISHNQFKMQGGKIYCNDDDSRPFATDATKFALFCAFVAQAIEQDAFKLIDILHLHDWHAACLSVLRKYSTHYTKLKKIKAIFTVHNLALQGIRPFSGDDSSLESWFPSLSYDGQEICDHRYPHCFNPMRSGINLSDKVHVVSPTYAKEVLKPSEPDKGFFGGEGLESNMNQANN
jgi:starch synthase